MVIELLFSMALAPVRMLFHTRFVLGAFLGWNAGWKSPPRADNETGWGEAVRRHGWHSVLGVAWGALVYWLNPSFIWWLIPIAGSLAVSVPVSVLSSRVTYGRGFRRAGLFKIPEETTPPFELRETVRHHEETPPLPGFVEAVVDPSFNALICATAHAHPHVPQLTQHLREKLVRTRSRTDRRPQRQAEEQHPGRAGPAVATAPGGLERCCRSPSGLARCQLPAPAIGSHHRQWPPEGGPRPETAEDIRPSSFAGIIIVDPE
jgi:membrane glycosyltransferase